MGSGFSTYIIDLRARTESADRIHQLSFNDTMTGLPNRIAFNERLAFDSRRGPRKGAQARGVLDRPRRLQGHQRPLRPRRRRSAADRGRRRACASNSHRANFWRARAATNFWRCTTSGNHPHDAHAFAERISQAFARAVHGAGLAGHLTASIGYSIFPTDTPERDQVLSNAKLAMYRGKTRQRGSICAVSAAKWTTARASAARSRATCNMRRSAANWC